jgi:predicted nuclease of predicted toxin-antitoxin system
MRILLDECLDWRLARDLVGHEVQTVQQAGWSGIKNGRLLTQAQHRFDVFVTVDKNLPKQQHLAAFAIAVVVIRAPNNTLNELRRSLPALLAALPAARKGQTTFVG